MKFVLYSALCLGLYAQTTSTQPNATNATDYAYDSQELSSTESIESGESSLENNSSWEQGIIEPVGNDTAVNDTSTGNDTSTTVGNESSTELGSSEESSSELDSEFLNVGSGLNETWNYETISALNETISALNETISILNEMSSVLNETSSEEMSSSEEGGSSEESNMTWSSDDANMTSSEETNTTEFNMTGWSDGTNVILPPRPLSPPPSLMPPSWSMPPSLSMPPSTRPLMPLPPLSAPPATGAFAPSSIPRPLLPPMNPMPIMPPLIPLIPMGPSMMPSSFDIIGQGAFRCYQVACPPGYLCIDNNACDIRDFTCHHFRCAKLMG